jgi:DNA-3-methyladenine glycosylase II
MIASANTTRTTTLQPVPPYDFGQVLLHLRTSASAILERIGDTAYARALHIAGQDVVLELRSQGTTLEPRLALRVSGAAVDDAVMAAAVAQVERIFHLTVDPAPFQAMLAGDPVFAAQLAPFAGLRPVIMATPYESLLWAIIGQQVNVAFAAKQKRALIALAGRTLELDGVTYDLLPDPAAVAALDPQALRDRQFSRSKANYVIAASAAIAAGALDLPSLREAPFADAVQQLTQIKGIGRWTAECVLMRGLGMQDSLPAGDIALRNVIGRSYGLDHQATEAEVRALAEQWVGWRGWAAFYWWRILQAERHGLGE